MREKLFKCTIGGHFMKGIFIMLLFSHQLYAQQTVTGQIVDQSNIGIPGVNIALQGKSIGEITDFDGNFSINASPEDVLVISYIGYITEKITVGSQTNIFVQLKEDVATLDDVVVIGYGTRRKSDLTGAVSQVTAKSFESQPITRVEEAIQGRAAGVTVARNNGAPGAGVKIRVRGVNSITGNNTPLVVIDGIFGGDLRTINPNDIASIEVLKDASSLAIYGSRGSNGVILVTTKKGAGKTKISLEHFTSISDVSREVDVLSSADFATLKNRDLLAVGSPARYTDEQISGFQNNPIDYQDELFRTGVSNTTQASISGGDEKFKYFISGNYTDQEGIILSTGYERYSIRSNFNAKINDRLSIGLNLFASRESFLNNVDSFNRFKGGLVLRALTWDPTVPVHDEDGNFILTSDIANNGFNPIAALLRSQIETVNDRFNANFDIKYKLLDGLTYNLIAGANTWNSATQSFRVEGDTSIPDSNHTFINFNAGRFTAFQISNIINWKKSFGDHNFDITGVYEFQGDEGTSNGYFTNDVLAGGFFLSDNGDQLRENFFNNKGVNSIQSYLGRLQYDFNKSLFLTASIRADQSSRFSGDNRTGYFPSAAIAYSFNNMSFIADGSTFSNLKFRGGYGEVGNQNVPGPARFALLGNVSASGDGVGVDNGVISTQIGNPDLKWETTTQFNVGLDLGFLNNRIDISVDYYQKNTIDLLLQTRVENSAFTRFENVGEVENKGIDFSISADIIDTDNFTWNSNFVVSHVKNEVIELDDGRNQIIGNITSIDGTTNALNVIEVGQPLGQFYGLTYLGTWKSTDDIPLNDQGTAIAQPGDARYLMDENGDNVFGGIGNGTPTLTWGFNNTFDYKNWNLNIFVQAAHDFDVYNQVEGALNGGTGDFRDNLSPNSFNAWTPDNETEIPRAGSTNLLNSSRYIEDGSYIRLSNVTLGYNFGSFFKNLDSAQVYVSGQNVFLITDYSGYDPEVTSNPVQGGSNADVGSGINLGAFPNPRTFTLGVKLGF
ncbi:TonB-dependent receptor [Aquimarina sp. RZ0]|uniref:SusC/RagA family TonB-linked outer membrane protein n=1 Tax=Aquimarina sp. RZ0 TaxID=2607730 RepID=UPI0011F3C736|nr:TonB-dependent receptor [Aquimarina sp. RZ0]KAA1247523.1 TonB-dependent receptor [Aquimarina sp. RZ0]